MRSGIGRRAMGALVAACLVGCGHRSQNVGPAGKLVATFAGVSDSQPGPVALDGGDYEFRWTSDKPVTSGRLQITLHRSESQGTDPRVAAVVEAPAGPDGFHGSAVATILKGVYSVSIVSEGSWQLSIYTHPR